ncbi:MAG TPA: TIGR00730 family Rossman fold protein [Phycisphaerae bacterium]|nr:TIGR00730 family Rossman fold protein [Phycisphaerales bacterium]HRX85826.1 TIGR00730 family Rossman fold protein [Phycisphaerae bacterium]
MSYPIRSVCVFCGSSEYVADKYHQAARDIARAIAQAGWTTVYGGGGVGLMGTLARTALEAGGTIVGVRPRFITDLEGDQLGLTELIATTTMHERIALLFERSDAFIALPGSCGTLDEVIQAITWKRLALHNKPVAILDLDGFYRPLAALFEHMITEGFIVPLYRNVSRFCPDVPAVMDYLNTYEPPEPLF